MYHKADRHFQLQIDWIQIALLELEQSHDAIDDTDYSDSQSYIKSSIMRALVDNLIFKLLTPS